MLPFQDEGNFEFTKNIAFKNYFTEKKTSQPMRIKGSHHSFSIPPNKRKTFRKIPQEKTCN